MRFYGFGNYYLSGIQHGIQAAHSIGEMAATVFGRWKGTVKEKTFLEWATFHKTIILLNGGNSSSLSSIFESMVKLEKEGMSLPFAKFNEDENSLNGALTSVGIIVPEEYYSFDGIRKDVSECGLSLPEILELIKTNEEFELKKWKSWEIELSFILSSYNLAF